MGLLIALVGIQMLIGMPRPWMPRRVREHAFERSTVERFVERMAPLFARLEKLSRPRWEFLTRAPWSRVSGIALVAIGVLLSLPIPFTNYPFGLVVLVFAVALIERDGVLLSLVWLATVLAAALCVSLGDKAIGNLLHYFS
jgi:hypothetical protein